MTTLHDKANELAAALRESPEFKEMKAAMAEIGRDASASKMLNDFRQRQAELQSVMMSGAEPDGEAMRNLQSSFDVLALNPLIARLFEAERQMSVTMEKLNQIITEPLQTMYTES